MDEEGKRDLGRYADDYRRHPFEGEQALVRRKHVLEAVARYRPESMLEVGCADAPLFTDVTGLKRIVVVEPAPTFFERASRAARSRAEVEVLRGRLEEHMDALASAAFDLVVLSGLLHEVEEPGAVLACVHRLCAPETVVHVNVPNAFSFHRLLALEMGMIEDVHEISATQQNLQQRRTLDGDGLRALVESRGFEVLRQGGFFVKPFTHAQMHELLEAGILPREVLEGLGRMIKYMPELGSEIYVDVKRKA